MLTKRDLLLKLDRLVVFLGGNDLLSLIVFFLVFAFLLFLAVKLLLLEELNIVLGELTEQLALLPVAHGRHAAVCGQHARAVLLPIEPLPGVDATVGPLESSLPLFDIIEELSFVLAAIRPSKLPVPVHFVLDPRPEVDTSIGPRILALAMDLVIEPLALVHATVGPDVATFAMLVPLVVQSLVDAAVFPGLFSLAVLKVVDPLSLVL